MADSTPSLSPRIQQIIERVPAPELKSSVENTVRLALAALAELKRVHLPQDQFEESETQNRDEEKHVELAPYVLSGVASINRLLGYVAQSFTPPPEAPASAGDDFDLEFDLVDGPTGDGAGLTSKEAQKPELSIDEQVADAAYAYGGMLRSRVMGFADRLEYALKQQETWPLLAELDDNKHKLTKAVQGLLFGVLGVFAPDARRDEILPEYTSAISEAVALRSVLADLTHAVNRFNAAIAQATPEQAVPLVVAIADRLTRFAARPEYRTLRAEDKKAVIDFRSLLHKLRADKTGMKMGELRLGVEGFSKFLDAMGAINHREVLVIHDRQRLEAALEHLQKAMSPGLIPSSARDELDKAAEILAALHGRNPELDDQCRLHRIQPPEPAELQEALGEWTKLVQGTLAMVGR